MLMILIEKVIISYMRYYYLFYVIGKVLLSYDIKKGVVGDEIPCPHLGRCSDSFAVVEGNLGFPSESVGDAILKGWYMC